MRILVAARPYDLSDAQADAFVSRHVAMVDHLAAHHRVEVVLLRPSHDQTTPRAAIAERVMGEVALPDQANTRASRLGRAARLLIGGRASGWERELAGLALPRRPRVVLTVGPWLDVEYRWLYRLAPSVHLFEEDLTRMPELAAQSRQARTLRVVEDVARRRAGMRPDAVVVISEAERASAHRRFGGRPVIHLPYSLDPHEWPLASDASPGDAVLVVGNLSQGRNSDGLVEVLAAIEAQGLGGSPIQIRLVSATGLSPSLAAYTDRHWVTQVDPGHDLAGEYRRASMALVASTRATGFKTTILQAWSAGCPVVCRPSSATTLGAGASSAVLVAPTVADVVAGLERLGSDPTERARLAAAGLARARDRHDRADEQRQLLDLVDRVADGSLG